MAISLARYWVTIHGDFTVFRNEVRAEAARLAGQSFGVRPTLDLAAFRAQFALFRATYLKEHTVMIRPVMAPGGLSRSAFASRTLNIKVGLDLTTFRAQWRVFAATYLNVIHRIHIHPVISASAVSGIVHAMGDAGSRSGSSFGGGFSSQWKLIIAAIVASLPLLQPLLSILGSLVQAAGALGAALPLALAATGTVVAALVLSFHNLGKAIKGQFSGDPTKEQREAYAKLSDSARAFVDHLLQTRVKLKGFQEEIQEQFFKPFLVGFKQLTASPAISILRAELGLIAGIAGAAGAGIATVFAQAAKGGLLRDILAGIRSIFADLAAIVPALTQTFLTLTRAALPFGQALTDNLVGGLARFNTLIGEAAADGRLKQFFADGLTALRNFGDVLRDVGSIVHSIFTGMAAGGGSALAMLSALTGRLAEFLKTAQGQQALAALAGVLAVIGQVISAVLVPLLPVVGALVVTLGGPLTAAITRLAPVLQFVLDTLGRGLLPIFDALSPVIDELVKVLADFLVLALVEVAAHIRQMMPFVQQLAAELGPHLIPVVAQLGKVLLALVPLIPAISQAMLQLLPLVIQMIPVFVAITKAMVFLGEVVATVIGWLVTLIGWVAKLVAAGLGFLFEEIAGMVRGAIPAFRDIASWVGFVVNFMIERWNAFTSFYRDVVGPIIFTAVGMIIARFTVLRDWVAAVIAAVTGFFTGFVAFFRDVFATAISLTIGALTTRFAQFQVFLDNLVAGIRIVWERGWAFLRDNIFTPMQNLITNTIPHAFRVGVDLIGFWWNRLRDVAAIPVRFVVNTIINKGIIGTFNTVAGHLGIPKIGEVSAGFAAGGEYSGMVAGAPSSVDNRIARGPNGEPIGLATGEFVVNARQTARHLPLIRAINSGMEGFAVGGLIGLLTDAAGWVKDRVGLGGIPGAGIMKSTLTGSASKMINGLVDWVKAKVAAFVSFDGGGSATASGLLSGIAGVLGTLRQVFGNVGLISGYRPGSRTLSGALSYHALRRAIDIAPVLAWAQYIHARYAPQLRELITPWQHLNIHNGRPHTYTGGVWQQHNFAGGNAHIHAALREGGLVGRVFDQGGAWPSGTFGFNGSGRTEQVASGNTMDDVLTELRGLRQNVLAVVAAVGLVAPGVGRELAGQSRAALQMARAR